MEAIVTTLKNKTVNWFRDIYGLINTNDKYFRKYDKHLGLNTT